MIVIKGSLRSLRTGKKRSCLVGDTQADFYRAEIGISSRCTASVRESSRVPNRRTRPLVGSQSGRRDTPRRKAARNSQTMTFSFSVSSLLRSSFSLSLFPFSPLITTPFSLHLLLFFLLLLLRYTVCRHSLRCPRHSASGFNQTPAVSCLRPKWRENSRRLLGHRVSVMYGVGGRFVSLSRSMREMWNLSVRWQVFSYSRFK